VLLKDGVELFSGGDGFAFYQAVVNEEDVFDEEVAVFPDLLELHYFKQGEWTSAKFVNALGGFFLKGVEFFKVGFGSFADALVFVFASCATGFGTDAGEFFELTFPVLVFAPSR